MKKNQVFKVNKFGEWKTSPIHSFRGRYLINLWAVHTIFFIVTKFDAILKVSKKSIVCKWFFFEIKFISVYFSPQEDLNTIFRSFVCPFVACTSKINFTINRNREGFLECSQHIYVGSVWFFYVIIRIERRSELDTSCYYIYHT